MPLKVRIGTMEVELENVEQVAELVRRLSPATVSQAVAAGPVESMELPLFATAKPDGAAPTIRRWDQETAWKFMSSLTGTAKSFMGALMVAKSVTSGDMARKLGVEPNLLGPAIRSIKSKSADLQKKVPFEVKSESGRTGKTYVVTLEFYGAASQPPPPGGQR